MKSEPLSCNRQLLRQSLGDSLSELQEHELARHLSECSACQQELERLAAEQGEWSRVGEILKQEARLSHPSESAGRAEARHRESDWHVAGDSYLGAAADFAVDFLDPSTTPQTLGRLGDIDIHEVIGRGGMGVVLKGFQHELNRPVAVKVLAPHLATSGAARKRFSREAQATAVVVHPNVMPILTVNSSGKLPYLVMPYVACESLQQRLDREGPLSTIDVVRIAMQVSSGLAAAHAQGLVHRDIKPANILLAKGVDRVMLTDFGLARAVDDATLTRTGVIAGTPQYMSPEQARGDAVDARSDLFSLGSVIYAMSTGRPPFRAESSYGILRRITDTEPRPIREIHSDVPDWLAAIVAKLHVKDAAERLSWADELASLLEKCLAHVQQPTAVPLPDQAQRLVKSARPHAGKGEATSEGETRRLERRALRQRTLIAGGIAAGILAIAGAVGLAIVGWPGVATQDSVIAPEPSDSEPHNAALRPPPAVSPDDLSPAAAWQDNVERGILELDDDLSAFEERTSRHWSNNAAPDE